MQKCYGVTIAGMVQDIGFRDFIETIGRSHFLKGIVFNDIGSTVRILCKGDNTVISEFFDEIKTKGSKRGIVFDITDKKELPLETPLPETFTKVSTDDVEDIGRKLDKGNSELNGINTKLSNVNSRLLSIGEDTHSLNKAMSSFVAKQEEHNLRMDEHNQRLGKILEKLVEK